jgi:hypothetical protein
MRAGLLLRIGILVVGISALYTLLTSGAYYVYLFFGLARDPAGLGNDYAAGVAAYFLTPLVFAFVCFAFSSRIERFLLGRAGDERLEIAAAPAALLGAGIKLVGVYQVSLYLGPLISTGYEYLAVKSSNPGVSSVQTNSDFLYNGAAILIGCLLCTRSAWVVRTLQDDPAPSPPP